MRGHTLQEGCFWVAFVHWGLESEMYLHSMRKGWISFSGCVAVWACFFAHEKLIPSVLLLSGRATYLEKIACPIPFRSNAKHRCFGSSDQGVKTAPSMVGLILPFSY